MKPTEGSVDEFIAGVTPEVRRRDAQTLLEIYGRVTGIEPVLWGTLVGYGACHYVYPTGNEGDMPLAAFAPRKASSTIYLMEGMDAYVDDFARLGPHSVSKACLYLKDLSKVDLVVLEDILKRSHETFMAGGFPGMDITITSS